MNKADETLQKEFPTYMVPVYEALPTCPPGRTRLLMAKEGLFIETALPWGSFIKQIWISPRPLPYGTVTENEAYEETYEAILNLIQHVIEPLAAEYADRELEWVGWIVWSKEDGFHYQPIAFIPTRSSAEYIRPELLAGAFLVAEIHSHHKMIPRFSSQDDRDERGRHKISVCLGNYHPEKKFRFIVSVRCCIEGFFFEHEENFVYDQLLRTL